MAGEGYEEAVSAFDKALGSAPPPAARASSGQPAPTESMFDNLGELDQDSGPAGGDDEEVDGDGKPVRQARRPEPESDDDDSDFDPSKLLDDDDEGDEDEEEDPDAEDEEDEDGGKKADDDSPRYKIMVDGEETEVSLNEALRGYTRTETFHRRMNQVNEAKQLVADHAQNVIAARNAVIEQYKELEAQVALLMPKEPDWDKLYQEDPVAARDLEKRYRDFQKGVSEIKAQREKVAADQAKADAEEAKRYASTEFPKFAAKAKWKSEEDAGKDLKAMRRTALQAGFTDEEVSRVYDSRMLHILLKASKYDRIMAQKPRPVSNGKRDGGQPSSRNGAVPGKRSAPKNFERAQNRLRQSGSVEDAANVFERIIRK